MSSFLALPDIKRIRVYLNGDPNQVGTNFIVHPRRIRNFEVFLKDLTEKMRPSFGAIRSVYTPTNGSRVRDLEDLENNQKYVASGHDGFHKLNYVTIEQEQAMKKTAKKTSKPSPKLNKSIQKSVRKRPYGWEPITFYIYKNGDDVSPAVKIGARRSELDNWEHLLLRAGEKLDQSGYVKRLYTLTGDWVRGPNGIKNGGYYVAVGGYEAFKHVMYGQLLERLPKEFIPETAPRPRRKSKVGILTIKDTKEAPKKTVPKIKAPAIIKKPKPQAVTNNNSHNDVGKENKDKNKSNNKTTNTKKPQREVSFKTTTQPTYKTKPPNKPSKPKATALVNNNNKKKDVKSGKSPPDSEDSAYVSDGEGWSQSKNNIKRKSFEVLNGVPTSRHVYYAPTTQKNRPKRVTLVNYDEDKGGVYKAKTKTPDAINAREVREIRNLPVELPLDEVEATEVGEEVIKYSEDEYSDTEEQDLDVTESRNGQETIYAIEPPGIRHSEVPITSPTRTVSA